MSNFFSSLILFVLNKIVANLPFHFLRIQIYKLFFKIDSSSTILMNVRFLTLKKNIIVGKNSVIGFNSILDGRNGKIIIGNNVDIANNVCIYTDEHDPNSETHAGKSGDVIIEDYAWIASRATLLPGIRVGKGAVVACNAVVTEDIPNYTIVGGVPAKQIGIRKEHLSYTLNYRPWFQ